MGTRIRFRTDCTGAAEARALVDGRFQPHREHFVDAGDVRDDVPAAMPGDVWRIHWYAESGNGPMAGHAICCPGCNRVHRWTSASNCGSRDAGGRCAHSGIASCWTWTGSAEAGTLTASPSLHCTTNYCNWHGYLRNGELVHC